MHSNHESEKATRVSCLRDERRCQTIVLLVPTADLFQVMTVPNAPPIAGTLRLAGPSMKKSLVHMKSVRIFSSHFRYILPPLSAEHHTDILPSSAVSDFQINVHSDHSFRNTTTMSPTLATLFLYKKGIESEVSHIQRASSCYK